MTEKLEAIKAYFAHWDEDLDRAKTLLEKPTYCLEGWLVLSCHIGALASLRFPTLRDNEGYKRIVLECSGMRDFYEQVDLLFFLQWPKSEMSTHGDYVTLKNHSALVTKIEAAYGDENKVRTGKRYVSQADFTGILGSRPFTGFDQANLQEHLPLFSNAELLYRYVRCRAVHSLRFPFVTKVYLGDGKFRYEDNHAITGSILYKTASCIVNNLRSECLGKSKWPWEL